MPCVDRFIPFSENLTAARRVRARALPGRLARARARRPSRGAGFGGERGGGDRSPSNRYGRAPGAPCLDELRRVRHVNFELCSSTASSAGVRRGEKHVAIPGAGRADRFQPRLDFSVVRPPAQIAALAPGQSVELCYEVRAPEKINLALELNRTSYAHWSATFRSQAQPGVAQAWVRIALR